MPVHRIHLRGPWDVVPLPPTTADDQGAARGSDSLPPPFTIQLPGKWPETLAAFQGRVRFQRRFNKPTNLAAEDRVFVCFEGEAVPASVRLNGTPLETLAPPARYHVTSLLQLSNQFEYELETPAAGAGPDQLPRVAIEIESAG